MIHYNSIIISIYILWIARIGGDTGSGSCWVSSTGFGCWMLALAVHDWHVKTRDQSLKPVQSLDPALDGVHLFKPCRIKNIGGRYGRLFLEREVSPIWWSSSWGINHDKPWETDGCSRFMMIYHGLSLLIGVYQPFLQKPHIGCRCWKSCQDGCSCSWSCRKPHHHAGATEMVGLGDEHHNYSDILDMNQDSLGSQLSSGS